jgi:hypothetical protein
VSSVYYSVDKLFDTNKFDIKDENYRPKVGVFNNPNDPRSGYKVWNNAKYGQVIDSFSQDAVQYVIVKFNAPGNPPPPSNDIEYIYLAP